MAPVTSPEQFAANSYDYIIIGGGTAGLTVAARLSEDPNVSVAVLEAGGWDPTVPGVNIPGLVGTTLANPKLDWTFMSVPQKHANNRSVFQPRGKCLGGSSALNFLGMNRAPAHEYDDIERLGNPGWNWNEFLKYMKKSENTHSLDPEVAKKYTIDIPDEKWHGKSGPVEKSYPSYFNPLHTILTTTFENVGIPPNSEPNNGNSLGSSMQFTSVDPRSATRSHSATAYYVPNSERKNLSVIVDSSVSKIIFKADSSPLVATGVEFINGDRKFSASARKEVIVCAGSFQSPQILELSGIGNKNILEKFGIPTLVDLPNVGENLQDHVYIPLIHEIEPTYDTIDNAQDPEEVKKSQELYAKKQGFLTSALADIFAFTPATTFASQEEMKLWDSQASALLQAASGGYKKQLDIQRQWYFSPQSGEAEYIPFPGFFFPSGLTPTPGSRYSSMNVVLLHPLSRGSVHITSSDVSIAPAIDLNYFAHPQDLRTLCSIAKLGLQVYKTRPLSDIVLKQVSPKPEDCVSDEALMEHIKNNCGPVYHPVGTASMLPREDGGVVDPQLKVYGTANVRVIDASIIPIELGAHTQATVYAVAEKGADIIKASM